MRERTAKATFGALLHDIGKLAYRTGDGVEHSKAGCLVLKEYIKSDDILECVAYHHKGILKNKNLRPDSPAYIVNLADSISAAADRRDCDMLEGDTNYGFDRYVALESIFNHLLGGCEDGRLRAEPLGEALAFPQAGVRNEKSDYAKILCNLKDGIHALRMEPEWINSLLALMEVWTGAVPSSTASAQRPDISLFDHSKIAAAVAACISEYLGEANRNDLRTELLSKSDAFCMEQAFMLFSADLSGIQTFLYTVTTQKALRSLRGRSFYLEMLMEHIIDELLEHCGLSRANLLYSGGGHCYVLLPNTQGAREAIEAVMKCARCELISQFGLRLYLAYATVTCSANDLMNKPEENAPYQELYRTLSQKLAQAKLNRYSAEEICLLNAEEFSDADNECKICGRLDQLGSDGLCQWCERFAKLSGPIQEKDVFALSRCPDPDALPLPSPEGTVYLYFSDEKTVRNQLKRDDEPILRVYTKNRYYTGLRYATHLYVGDYHASNLMSELADSASGIRRLAVCRADVDNLGEAFISGFEQMDASLQRRNYYVTLSRTATLSRQLLLFFKFHINYLLGANQSKNERALPVSIVYSGGDDIFLVGAWDGVIEAMQRIHSAFDRFTAGRLSISAGIGFFSQSFPIRRAAAQTEELVREAKGMEKKNAVSLFEPGQGHVYHWTDFTEQVINKKLDLVRRFFDELNDKDQERGMAFLYRLLQLIRASQEQINAARLAYLLARMEDGVKGAIYGEFSKQVMEWHRSSADRAQLITAIYLYVYEKRRDAKDESYE